MCMLLFVRDCGAGFAAVSTVRLVRIKTLELPRRSGVDSCTDIGSFPCAHSHIVGCIDALKHYDSG